MQKKNGDLTFKSTLVFGEAFSLREIRRIFPFKLRDFKLWKTLQ